MAATCSSSSWISAKVKPWASKRTIACSRVNFCGSGSGMRGGETFRTIGMLHLLRGLYRTPVIVQQRPTNVAANLKFDTCQISGLPRQILSVMDIREVRAVSNAWVSTLALPDDGLLV